MSFILFGFFADTSKNILAGFTAILREPGILITDYIVIGGVGAAFINAGLLTLFSILLLYLLDINISGISIASIFLMAGFALFGKNILNVWFIILGTFLYAKLQKHSFSKYVYIGLFGTSLAPAISEILFNINLPVGLRIMLALFVGVSIGFLLPPLSSHFLKVHQGFNLYNIGFTAGIIGTILVSISKSYGFITKSNLFWSSGNNLLLSFYLMTLFTSMLFIGYFLEGKSFRSFTNIFSYTGRLVSDYVILEGFGASLMNMGLNGVFAMAYVLLVKGELNGPSIGGILTIVGFGAFGKHLKNITPIFIGVFIGSLTKTWNINDPSIILAALFGTALAPIAGEFGWVYGIAAGFINSSVVLNVGVLHGGFNLYNTGFSAGIVAAVMLPIIEAFRREGTK